MRIPADAIAENRCNSRKKEIRPRSVCFEHMIEEATDALELSHQVRKDLKELSRFWTFRSFEEYMRLVCSMISLAPAWMR